MLVRDFSTEHEKNLRLAMEELVGSGVEGGFLIFETEGNKTLEFSYSKKDGLTLELPRPGLTPEEKQRLSKVEGLESMTEDEVSFHLQVGLDTRVGARMAHRVFREVFRCPERYPVHVTLDA
jgi:hypothetical protein